MLAALHAHRTRLAVTGALLSASAATLLLSSAVRGSTSTVAAGPTPSAACAPGGLPETAAQGRVPLSDVESGRAAQGYRCNTELVGQHGDSGGYHVWRYVDAAGRVCAYYDSTLLLGRDGQSVVRRGPGTVVLDMTDPARPVQTAVLATPAMSQPHESLRLNEARGLLVAVAGSPATAPGVLDVYDVTEDCRAPVLRSSTPTGLLGHESGFAPDGLTYWAASYVQGSATLQAVDLTDPASPRLLHVTTDYVLHGMSLSDDGRRLYGADQSMRPGFRVLEVSDVQDRRPDPQIRPISYTAWPEISIPQVSEPITIEGRPFALEVDEFAHAETGRVGAARLLDLTDETAPRVVSNMRLAVNEPDAQGGEQREDLGATSPAQGYTAHYCSVPRREDPHLVACSFILSGLRIFDVRDPQHPVEVGYFNVPVLPADDTANPVTRAGAFAMSAPAWDVEDAQVWYSDGNNGFYAVRLVGAAAAALRDEELAPAAPVVEGAAAAPATPATSTPSAAPASGRALAATGPGALPGLASAVVALGLLGLAVRGRQPG